MPPASQATQDKSRPQRFKLGLGLEGGGAKGAYSMGAIKACQDRGVAFNIIAGTSVGALNGAIVAANVIEEGCSLWGSLAFGRVARFRRPICFWAPLVVAASAINKINPLRAWARLHSFELIVWTVLTGFFILFAAREVARGTPEVLTRGVAAFVGLLILRFGPSAVIYGGASALVPTPLKAEIERLLGHREFTMPLFITAATGAMILDPDDAQLIPMDDYPDGGYIPSAQPMNIPEYVRIDSLDTTTRVSALMASAALPFGIFPTVRVSGHPYRFADGGVADNCPWFPLFEICEEIVMIRLRPTSARGVIPVGLLESEWSDRERTIRLARLDARDRERLYYSHTDREHEQNARGRIVHSPPVAIPRCVPRARPDRVICVAPSSALESLIPDSRNVLAKRSWILGCAIKAFVRGGGLGATLRGTMNFERSATRRWMRLGYREMDAAITEHGLAPPSAP